MYRSARNWQEYWSRKAVPEHSPETVEHYRECGAELRLLFEKSRPRRVLEVGCGNGALYEPLGFAEVERYLGVDFSQRMLQTFRADHPGAEVVHADGASFRTDDEFDLIFSSQVAQYWRPQQLADHLDNAVAMLADGGTIVVSGIPWSRMRLAYAHGDLTGGRHRRLPVTVLSFLSELVRKRLGHWYDLPAVAALATARGLDTRFYGSMHYPYRFHAVLRR